MVWLNEMRYVDIFMVRFVSSRSLVDYAKRSFYCAANAINFCLGYRVWPLRGDTSADYAEMNIFYSP